MEKHARKNVECFSQSLIEYSGEDSEETEMSTKGFAEK